MKELLKAVVDKDFPLFEEIANQALAGRVKVLLEGYRPIAVGKFLAESENVSRHKGGEYVFEDGSYTDISKTDVAEIFEAHNSTLEKSILGAIAAIVGVSAIGEMKEMGERPNKEVTLAPHDGVNGVKVHPEFSHIKEAVDFFISASKKNFDAYCEDPKAVVEALLEAEFQLPHRAAKQALFESFRKDVSFTTVNELTEANSFQDNFQQQTGVDIGDQVFHSGKNKSGTVTGVNSATGALKVRVHNMGGAETNEEWQGGYRRVDMMKDKPAGGNVDLSAYQR